MRAAGSGSDTATPTISTMVGNNVPRSEAVGVTPASNTDSSNIPAKPKTVGDTSVSTTKKAITVNNESPESSQTIKDTPKSAQPKVIIQIDNQPVNRNVPDHTSTIITNNKPKPQPLQEPQQLVVRSQNQDLELPDAGPSGTMILRSAVKRMAPVKDHDKERAKKIIRVYYTVEIEIDTHNKDAIYKIDNPVPIPTLYQSTINDPIYGPAWLEVVKKKTNDIMANSTFKIVEEPEGVNIVTAR